MDLSKFAERLSELVSDKNKNAKTVGEELGCGNSTVSHYLTGRYLPTVEMTVRLADYFNCTTDYLLGAANESDARAFKVCPPFNERFAEVCKHFGKSRYELQKLTGISESVMRYWIKGKTKPSIANVARIAEAFGCSIDFLLGREK